MPFQWQTREPQNIGQMIELMMAPARAKARAAEVRGQANASALGAAGNAAAGTIGAVMENRATAPQRAMQARSMQLDLQAKERDAALTDQAGQAAKDFSTWVSSSPTLPTPEQVVGRYGPELGARFVNVLKTIHPDAEPMVVNPGDTVIDKRNPNGPPLYAAPPKPDLMEVGGTVIDKNKPEAGALYTAPDTSAQKETARHNQEMERIGALTAGRQDAAAQETARHNRATEAAAGADTGLNLTPEALDLTAKQFAMTGLLPPMGMGKQAAAARTQIINRAADLFSGLDLASQRTAYEANKSSLTAIQKQRDAMGAFEDTAKKNLEVFLTQAKKVTDTGSPFLNRPLRAIDERLLGAPSMTAFNVARRTVIPEFAKILANPGLSGQLSDTARKEIEDVLSGDATLPQTIAATNILLQDVKNRTTSYDDQIKAIQQRIATPPGGKAGGTITVTSPGGKNYQFPDQATADKAVAEAKAKGLWK